MDMSVVIKVIGIVFVLMGIVYFLRPDFVKGMIGFFKQGSRIYIAGVVRFALAIVFLLAARRCNIRWAIVAFGIVFLLSGLLVFLVGPKRFRPILEWWEAQHHLVLRLAGVAAMVLGGVVIYCA